MKPPRSLTKIYPHVTSCHDAKRPVEIEIRAKDVSSATKKRRREEAQGVGQRGEARHVPPRNARHSEDARDHAATKTIPTKWRRDHGE